MRPVHVASLFVFLVSVLVVGQSKSVLAVHATHGLPADHKAAAQHPEEVVPGPVPPANFRTAVLYSSGGVTADAIVAIDVNGDGKPDVVVANQCIDSQSCAHGVVGVLLNNGDGTFAPALAFSSGGFAPGSVAVADVNGDGKLDVVVENTCVTSTNCAAGSVGVLLGNGDGTFRKAVTYGLDGAGAAVAVSDINRDGKLDLAVATNNGLDVLLGNGDGTFQTAVLHSTDGSAVSIAVGDLNHDGNPDVVVDNPAGGARGDGSVSVLLGNGDGTFQPLAIYDSFGFNPNTLAIADMNHNGFPDILVANALGRVNQTAGSVGLLFNNGDGTFPQGNPVNIGGIAAHGLAVGDVNGDGNPDIVVGENGNVSVVLTGDQIRHHGAGQPLAIAIADVDGDGQPDILAATKCVDFQCATGGVAVLISKPEPTKTTVTTSGSPSQSGQAVTFTATITSKRGLVANGQTITFLDGTKPIGTGTTANGVATFTTSSLDAKTHTIKAEFAGYPFFKASSGAVKQVVNP